MFKSYISEMLIINLFFSIFLSTVLGVILFFMGGYRQENADLQR
jgi:hypothetical protein